MGLSGCLNLNKKVDKARYNNGSLFNKNIAVLPFEEMREPFYLNNFVLAIVPLFPFGFTDSEKVENINDEFTESFVKELRWVRFFRSAE